MVESACSGSFGIKGLFQRNAELFTYRLEFLEVFLVLSLVLDLIFDTCYMRLTCVDVEV